MVCAFSLVIFPEGGLHCWFTEDVSLFPVPVCLPLVSQRFVCSLDAVGAVDSLIAGI